MIDQKEVSYTVNDPSLTAFTYNFVQTNSCGYPQKIIVDNPAAFITHDKNLGRFRIETKSRSDAQIYSISLSSTISVFDDYTLTTRTEHSAQTELTVTVIDPCLVSQLPELIIPDLAINVHEGESSESIAKMVDSVSQSITSSDGNPFCGEIILELLDLKKHQSYLEFEDRTLTALSIKDSEIGIYEAQLSVCMDEYPEIETHVDFKVIISPCQVSEISLVHGPKDTRYAISSEEKLLAYPSTNQGVCKYPVTYEIVEP